MDGNIENRLSLFCFKSFAFFEVTEVIQINPFCNKQGRSLWLYKSSPDVYSKAHTLSGDFFQLDPLIQQTLEK